LRAGGGNNGTQTVGKRRSSLSKAGHIAENKSYSTDVSKV
jgi:hypothetical protein